MGYEISYCASCAMQVRGADLEKHTAIRVDDLAYCAKCAPGVLKTLTPEKADEALGRIPSPPAIRQGSTSRIAKVQSKSSGRLKAQKSTPIPIVAAPPSKPHQGLLIAVAAGVALLVLVVIVLMSRDSAPEPRERERRVEAPPPKQAERPKPEDTLASAKALIDLEQLAASGADPLEILIRCDEIKGLVRGRPQEAKWREIQDRATVAKKAKDADQAITRGLDQVRSLRKFDVRFDKKAEIRSLLERMRGLGGPRQGEVQQMADDYDRDLAAAVQRFRDLVAWYRFTIIERLGADDSGRENNAISMTGVSWNGDKAPGARFSGGGIAIPVAVRDDFTIALWVRTRQGPSGNTQWFEAPGLVDAEAPGVTDDFGTAVLKGRFALGVGKPDLTLSSRSAINDGRWRHVAATRSSASGEMKVYVDGVLEGTAAGPKGPRSAPSRMTIGQIQTGTNPFDGDLDDIRIYARVLPDSEVAALARRN